MEALSIVDTLETAKESFDISGGVLKLGVLFSTLCNWGLEAVS